MAEAAEDATADRKMVEPLTLAAIGGVTLLALAKKSKGAGYVLTEEWQKEIASLSSSIESRGILVGFSRFLIPCAWIESRGNPTAGSSAYNNAARGWFGMRPKSAFNWRNNLQHLAISDPNLLKDPLWAIATAADYTRRLIEYNVPKGRAVTWQDIRRGWRYPYLTDINKADADEIESNLNQFKRGIKNTTKDYSIIGEYVEIGDWPGIDTILDWLKQAAHQKAA